MGGSYACWQSFFSTGTFAIPAANNVLVPNNTFRVPSSRFGGYLLGSKHTVKSKRDP